MNTQKYSKEFESWFSRSKRTSYVYDEFSGGIRLDSKYLAWKAWNAGRDRLKKDMKFTPKEEAIIEEKSS